MQEWIFAAYGKMPRTQWYAVYLPDLIMKKGPFVICVYFSLTRACLPTFLRKFCLSPMHEHYLRTDNGWFVDTVQGFQLYSNVQDPYYLLIRKERTLLAILLQYETEWLQSYVFAFGLSEPEEDRNESGKIMLYWCKTHKIFSLLISRYPFDGNISFIYFLHFE